MTQPPPYPNGIYVKLENHDKRISDLEAAKIDVLAERINTLEERVDFLIRTLWTVFGALILMCFTFLWATAQGWVGGGGG